jgi:transposase
MQTPLHQTDKYRHIFSGYSRSYIQIFFLIVGCLLLSNTSCLYRCKDKVRIILGGKKRANNTDYTRLIRFFKAQEVGDFIRGIGLLILKMANVKIEFGVIDRTNWDIGHKDHKKRVNILAFGIIHANVFIPLVWQDLDYKGNSDCEKRKNLIDRFVKLCQLAKVPTEGMVLLGDREFIGTEWFKYLTTQGFVFVIRVKSNALYELVGKDGTKKVKLKFFSQYVEKYGIYAIPLQIKGITYTIVITKNQDRNASEKYIYLISTLKDAKLILELYSKRWKIECCFKHFKNNGFRLEEVNLKAVDKINLMFGCIVIAYLMALLEGIIEHELKPIPNKVFKNKIITLSQSIFRRGLTIINPQMVSIQQIFEVLNKFFQHQILVKT